MTSPAVTLPTPRPAQSFRKLGRDQTQLSHAQHPRAVERAFALACGIPGRELLRGEAQSGVTYRRLFGT
jgi:hypothetical protein